MLYILTKTHNKEGNKYKVEYTITYFKNFSKKEKEKAFRIIDTLGEDNIDETGDKEVSEQLLKDFIKDGICADIDISNALNGGVNIEYFYTVKETGEEFLVVFTEEECK